MASEDVDCKLSFSEIEFGQREMFEKQFKTVTGLKPTKDQMGFVHDRDVVIFYTVHDHLPRGVTTHSS